MICHKLTAYLSPTGEEEIVADLTKNYGTYDGPAQWQRYSDSVLIDKCGMIR
jgi:hypothetical protein